MLSPHSSGFFRLVVVTTQCIWYACVGQSVLAQEVLISDNIQVRADEPHVIVGELNDRIIMYHLNSLKNEFLVFDEHLNHIKTREVLLEKNKVFPIGVSIYKDVLNYTYYFREKGRVHIAIRQYNTQLDEIYHDTLLTINNIDYTPNYSIQESEDHSKIVFYKTERQSNVQAVCFDLDRLSIIWGHEFELSQKRRLAPILVEVSNQGAGYFIYNASPRGFRKETLVAEMIRIEEDMDEVLRVNFEIDDLDVQSMLLRFDNVTDYLVLAGTYAEKADGRINGSYVLRIDPLNPMKRFYEKLPYDAALEKEMMAEQRDKKDGIQDIIPIDLVLRGDGGMVLLSEVQHINQRYGGVGSGHLSAPGNRNWTDYTYEDILIQSIHPDGKLHWQLVLHKKQYSQDDFGQYSSFFTFINRGALHLFYNDEISLDNTVSKYSINGEGAFERRSVMSTEYEKQRMRISEAVQINGTSLVIPSDHGSNMVNLIKIDYRSKN